MQAHAVRLDDAWVTPTVTGFSETEAGHETVHINHLESVPEKNGNMILSLSLL